MASYSSWMGDLKDKIGDIPLCQLPIPGSHDSGTTGLPASAETQDLVVLDQLKAGIRFFDLRPKVDNGKFFAYHYYDSANVLGIWPSSNNVDDIDYEADSIFGDIRVFLADNPGEVVILKFQSFAGSGAQDFSTTDHGHFRTLMNYSLPLVKPCAVSTLTLNSLLAQNPSPLHNPDGTSPFGGVIVFYEVGPRSAPEPPLASTPDSWENFWPYRTADDQEKSSTDYIRIWDPYWHDYAAWLGDDTEESIQANWIPYHERNLVALKAMRSARFFVTQAQMEVGGGDMKITLQQSAINNNEKNAGLVAGWMQNGVPSAGDLRPNILTMDFIEYGPLCPEIIAYFDGLTQEQIAEQYSYCKSFVDEGDFAIRIGSSFFKVYDSRGYLVPTPTKDDALRFRIWVMVGRDSNNTWFGRLCYQVVGGSWDGYYLSMNKDGCVGLYQSSDDAGWDLQGTMLYSEYSLKYVAATDDNQWIYATADAPSAAVIKLDWS